MLVGGWLGFARTDESAGWFAVVVVDAWHVCECIVEVCGWFEHRAGWCCCVLETDEICLNALKAAGVSCELDRANIVPGLPVHCRRPRRKVASDMF